MGFWKGMERGTQNLGTNLAQVLLHKNAVAKQEEANRQKSVGQVLNMLNQTNRAPIARILMNRAKSMGEEDLANTAGQVATDLEANQISSQPPPKDLQDILALNEQYSPEALQRASPQVEKNVEQSIADNETAMHADYYKTASHLPTDIRTKYLTSAPDEEVAKAATNAQQEALAAAQAKKAAEDQKAKEASEQQRLENTMAKIRLLPDSRLKLSALAENGFLENEDAQAAIARIEQDEKQKAQKGFKDPSGLRTDRLFDLTLQIISSGRGKISADKAAHQAIQTLERIEQGADPNQRIEAAKQALKDLTPEQQKQQIATSTSLSEDEKGKLREALGLM